VKTRRFSEAQVLKVLREADAGKPVVIAALEHGASGATIHRWRARYGGMTLTQLKRLKTLEEENARLKRIVAQQATDIELLKEIGSKNWRALSPGSQ
jgi:putative transposase